MRAVNTAEVIFLIDNTTDSLSLNPGFVETGFAGDRRRGMQRLSGKCLCCAAHGLSCLITTRTGSASGTLLFDIKPEEWVFERNVVRLGVDLGDWRGGAVAWPLGSWGRCRAPCQ
jgi:7,8-dihydropterin-6-yl-methyl-4-(beta-D-ribofuranosyl)aminobenzene 5'-phosphate synthase